LSLHTKSNDITWVILLQLGDKGNIIMRNCFTIWR